MSFYDVDRLYELLPAFYRIRDIQEGKRSRTPAQQQQIRALQAELEAAVRVDPSGPDAVRLGRETARRSHGPLRSLLEVLAEQIAVLEADIEQLEDDQFIETCAEWATPYIGRLVGVRGLTDFPDDAVSRRAQVANALRLRRRKGTAAALEQLARDVTRWDAAVVEFFERLVSTQYLNHPRPHAPATVDLRGRDALPPLEGPFGVGARTVEVRRAESGRGRFNIPNIGVFLFRVRSFAWTAVPAFRHTSQRFSFHPLGSDLQLFNLPVTEKTVDRLAGPDNVSRPLRRREIRDRLDDFYGRNRSFAVLLDGQEQPLGQISICNLADWSNAEPGRIAVDPERGRLVFPQPQPSDADVRTSFRHGFGFEMGGGEYDRAASPSLAPLQPVTAGDSAALSQALTDASAGGSVEIRDNSRYSGSFALNIGAGRVVELRAADQRRPTLALQTPLDIFGEHDSEASLHGLLIGSGASFLSPPPMLPATSTVYAASSSITASVAPGSPPTSASSVEAPGVEVEIRRSILGAVRIHSSSETTIDDSIIDALSATAVAYSAPDGVAVGAELTCRNSTFIGKVAARILRLASNTLFEARLAPGGDAWAAPVRAELLQEGCVRFSCLPLDSAVPKRHRCVPAGPQDQGRVRPIFCSLRYGDPGFALLHPATAEEILSGADDGAEIGAFHDLYQPQREAALRARLREFLRFGLEAGIHYVS